MKKLFICSALVLTTLMLAGCTNGNTIISGASAVYAVMAGLSLLLLVTYCYLIQKKGVPHGNIKVQPTERIH